MVDDLAYNDLGCFEFPGDIDPACKTAPVAFMEKSAYAAPNQAVGIASGKRVSLNSNIDRLASQGAGYATAAFGKWYLGIKRQFDPTRHGFDHYWPVAGERSGELKGLTEKAIAYIEENKSIYKVPPSRKKPWP